MKGEAREPVNLRFCGRRCGRQRGHASQAIANTSWERRKGLWNISRHWIRRIFRIQL